LADYMKTSVDDPDTGAKYTLDRATQISNEFVDQVRKMTFQEHRLGVFLEKEWQGEHWYAAMQTWAGMAERNFWLDENERQTTADLAKLIMPDSDGTFNQKDYMSMRWGMGDTRLRLGYGGNCFTPHVNLRVGLQATLPTARGIYRPTSGKLMPTGFSDFTKSFLMDRLREVLIEAQLGSGHYAVGAFSRLLIQVPRTNLTLKLHGQADYALESGEHRYLTLVRQKNAAGTADLNITAASSDKDVRRYINQFFIPKQVAVTVAPGVTVQAGATAQWRRNNWSVYGGYDFFYKSKEQLSRFNTAGEENEYLAPYESMSPRKEQHRLLGGVTYDTSLRKANLLVHVFDDLDLTFRLHGSGAVHSEGMADDFSISLSFGGRF
ncbi:MAG: hypothetical protein PVJ92_02880, partial [Candidatus Dependentiae bacterium]